MAVFKLIGTYMYVHVLDCGEYVSTTASATGLFSI